MSTEGAALGGARGFGARVQAAVAGAVGRPLFWLAFVVIIMGFMVVRTMTLPLPPPLPILATVPEFSLTDQSGKPFGSGDLIGRVWVADFVFTRCPTVCPLLTDKMAALQHRARNLGDAFRLVSFSVDPAYDTPAVLAAYASAHKASPRMWEFLTGTPEAVKKTVVEGMKVAMGRDSTGPADPAEFGTIFHGTHFVLVDQVLRIRGYYDSSDPEAIETLVRDIGMVANRGE